MSAARVAGEGNRGCRRRLGGPLSTPLLATVLHCSTTQSQKPTQCLTADLEANEGVTCCTYSQYGEPSWCLATRLPSTCAQCIGASDPCQRRYHFSTIIIQLLHFKYAGRMRESIVSGIVLGSRVKCDAADQCCCVTMLL
jgi:hypothetical protein